MLGIRPRYMAAAFPYYFKLTDLSNSVISDAWYEPANTTSGNFTANITGNVNRQLNIETSDFTLICTIDRLRSTPNSGAVEILAGSGWTFGIDHSSFFFVKSDKEAYTFDDINIGKKSCFALTKVGGAFNVTNFNVPSQAIESTQTQFFNPNNVMTGTGLYFAGGNPISGVKNFYGTVDQLVLLNVPISNKDLGTLFSGFLQQNLITIPPTDYWQLTYSSWEQTGNYTTGQINFLQSGAAYFAGDALSYLDSNIKPNGGYYGEMSITGSTTKIETSRIDPTGFINPCTTFGLTQIGTHTMGSGGVTGFSAPVLINYEEPFTLLSFDFSALNPGMSLDLTYELIDAQTSFVAQNTGYYSGFYMDGVNAPRAQRTILKYYPTRMQEISRLGKLDLVSSKYYTPGTVSGNTIYADGYATSYVQSGDYVKLSKDNINQLVYDSITTSSLIALNTGTTNYATGNFFPKTSVVFSGTGIRTLDYLETSQYHLYHAKILPIAIGAEVYSNTDTNWQ